VIEANPAEPIGAVAGLALECQLSSVGIDVAGVTAVHRGRPTGGMAGTTGGVRVPTFEGKTRLAVVEAIGGGGEADGTGFVARGTGGTKVAVTALVAGPTGGGTADRFEVALALGAVARRTGQGGVGGTEGKTREGMVEGPHGLEGALIVAAGAVGSELAPVTINVAAGTLGG
jgi:hypothetical protein